MANRIELATKVIEAARCIRHWHDYTYKNGDEGMVVSGEHVRKLWQALSDYDSRASLPEGVEGQKDA